jgi:hypothetical protein
MYKGGSMGILSRWHRARARLKERADNREFANSLTPGSVGSQGTTTLTDVTTPAQTNAYTRGPNPNPMTHTMAYKNPYRHRARFLQLQPEIPVAEPWVVSSVYVQNTGKSSGTADNNVAQGQFIGEIRAVAPPMTTQRDLEYDNAGAFLQRFEYVTPSQRYFDAKVPLPEFTTPAVFANMVIAGNNEYFPVESKRGWYQSFVAGVGVRDAQQMEIGTAPPWLLSTPLNVKTRIYSEYDHRPPVVGKAPKRKRSAGG